MYEPNLIHDGLQGPNNLFQVFRITGGNDKQGFPMKQGVVR